MDKKGRREEGKKSEKKTKKNVKGWNLIPLFRSSMGSTSS